MQRGMKCDMELTTQSYGQFIEAVEQLARKYRPARPTIQTSNAAAPGPSNTKV